MLLKLLQERTIHFCYVMKVLQNIDDLQRFQEQRGNYFELHKNIVRIQLRYWNVSVISLQMQELVWRVV